MSKIKKMMILIRSVVISYMITILLFMIYAFLLVYTNISESTIPTATFIISIMSIFVGSSLSLLQIKENGILHGAIVGFIYFFIIYLLSSTFITGFSLTSFSFSMIILDVIFGIIGGIIGVNMIKEERKKV